VVYLLLEPTQPPWGVAVHPGLPFMELARAARVGLGGQYHNSNMRRFPMRVNRGKRAIHYGERLNIDDAAALSRVIAELTRTAPAAIL
jgi:hypothetical protein